MHALSIYGDEEVLRMCEHFNPQIAPDRCIS
jgi:hypothetical protein